MTSLSDNQELRILVVKLTSMGDTLHVLPALSDLVKNHPAVQIDWMIEDSFIDIPQLHSNVNRVIPVSTRRWRSFNSKNLKEFFHFLKLLRAESYDYVIDAQGLMKSAALGFLARQKRGGIRIGFSADSIKERPAARFYQRRIDIAKNQHAIDRQRQLFAMGFGYAVPKTPHEYNIKVSDSELVSTKALAKPTIFFFPSTTWASKHISDSIWHELGDIALKQGYNVKISWGNEEEKSRAKKIADRRSGIEVLPKMSLGDLASQMSTAIGAIAVDTGLGHLAAGLGLATVSVYGATDANLTGAVGENSGLLQTDYPCSPCFLKQCNKLNKVNENPPCYATISASEIWEQLSQQIV